MTTRELKEKYLKFFEGKGHKIISGASLIPENDPTALFISAGMHPLVPYLLGEKHPMGDRLVSVQKCIRTGDIDEVGDDVHLTFFEMLGNWGLGSYWKKEAIEMSWEFLTSKKWLGLDKEKISVSCFKGDAEVPKDEESAKIWESVGIPKKRIKFLGRDENWWGPAGKTGPCGPDTEMFYDGIEIWNDVFMEYNKISEGKYESLKQKNVDTGMGVERTVAILNGYGNVYETDVFKPIIGKIEKLSGKKYKDYKKEFRIVADHIKASVFILASGVDPHKTERGYVLRRLLRKAILFVKTLGIQGMNPIAQIGETVITIYKDEYSELEDDKNIISKLIFEGAQFDRVLQKGGKEYEKIESKKTGKIKFPSVEDEKQFDQYVKNQDKKPIYSQPIASDGSIMKLFTVDDLEKSIISGKEAFDLYQTHGFPLEIIKDLASRKGLSVDEDGFYEEFKKHQELSRTATAGKFKSGLADNSEQVTKLHTATHLLLAALRKVLGEHVFQKGSNITAERLRLDFSHSEKLTAEQIKKVEDAVNEVIIKNLPVNCNEVSLEKAKEIGAMGVFESKYGDKVKVYSVGTPDCPYSCEICAGPHVKSTGELGHFKILKEEASSAGVRRIKAILE